MSGTKDSNNFAQSILARSQARRKNVLNKKKCHGNYSKPPDEEEGMASKAGTFQFFGWDIPKAMTAEQAEKWIQEISHEKRMEIDWVRKEVLAQAEIITAPLAGVSQSTTLRSLV